MSSLQSSIFRQASESSLLKLSVRNYSLAESDDSPTGIETWLSPASTASSTAATTTTATTNSAPEILWEDSSHMKVFSFRTGRDKSRGGAPLKSSLSAAQYRRQPPPSSTPSEASKGQSSAVSLELASAWLQMGEMRRSEGAAGSTSTDSSHSSHTSGDDRRWNERRPADTASTASTTRSSRHNNKDNQTKKQTCVVNTGARPRWRSSSRSVAAATLTTKGGSHVLTRVQGRAKKRDSVESRVSVSVKDDRPSHYDAQNSSSTTTGSSSKTDRDRSGSSSHCDVVAASRTTTTTTSSRRQPRGVDPPASRQGRTHTQQQSAASQMATDDSSKWKTAEDAQSGRTYYYHTETRETQWRKPLALASETEKEEMRTKEERQRNFFAAMEANILKNLATGAMVEATEADAVKKKEEATTATFLQTRALERPGLVRTISTMDEQVLTELVERQPSNRNLFGANASPNGVEFPSATRSFMSGFSGLEDQAQLLSLTDKSVESFRSSGTSSRMMSEESLFERQESLGTLLGSLPDDPGSSSRLGASYLSTMGGSSNFHEESAADFEISDEEIKALAQLAQISKQMAHLPEMLEVHEEEDGEEDLTASLDPRLAMARSGHGLKRASMTELSLEILLENSEHSNASQEETTPKKEQLQNVERSKALSNLDKPAMGVFVKPKLSRRNTCGTIYVGSTMSAPDKDATIKCICGVFRAHVLQAEREQSVSADAFVVFNDLESHQTPVNGRKKTMSTPSLEEITAFYRDVFRRSQMESDCIIMSLIYVERLIKTTEGGLRPRSSNWRSVLFSCMILASKVWDDLSMWNKDFSQTCPAGVKFSLQRINELEIAVLSALSYDVKVPASEYAKYYFLLRSMLIKSGLSSVGSKALNQLDVEGAKRLQQVSARYQASHEATPKRPGLATRSRSVASVGGKIDQTKAGLEHMVEL